jgi:hypothetical protein
MARKIIREVSLWGDYVFCKGCGKMQPKEDFKIAVRRGRQTYESYCLKCRGGRNKKQRKVLILDDDISDEVKMRRKYAQEHGLLVYPVTFMMCGDDDIIMDMKNGMKEL